MIRLTDLLLERKLKHFEINIVWDFLESRPFGGSHKVALNQTADKIFQKFTKKEFEKYKQFAIKWKKAKKPLRPLHPRERDALNYNNPFENIDNDPEELNY